jgi:hypothetical protein
MRAGFFQPEKKFMHHPGVMLDVYVSQVEWCILNGK